VTYLKFSKTGISPPKCRSHVRLGVV
jgi:hypothetical protein